MMSTDTAAALDLARKVLRTEAAAILGLVDRIDGEFERAVQLLFDGGGDGLLDDFSGSAKVPR